MENTKLAKFLVEPKKKHLSTILLLHGFGDKGGSYIETAKILQKSLPNTRFVMPTAPVIPVDFIGGKKTNSWYNLAKPKPKEDKDPKQLEEISEMVRDLIDEEHQILIEKETDPIIFLLGFSQGAGMCLFTTMFKSEKKIAGVIMLSGFLVNSKLNSKERKQINKSTPVLMYHGSADDTILQEWSQISYIEMMQMGMNVQYSVFRGLDHQISSKELKQTSEWILNLLKN